MKYKTIKYKTLIITAFTVTALYGQEKKADPHRAGETPKPQIVPGPIAIPFPNKQAEAEMPPNISICYETFSLPLARLRGLRLVVRLDALISLHRGQKVGTTGFVQFFAVGGA